MSHGLPLLQGERVLWAGVRGQPARLPGGAAGMRMAYAWLMASGFGGMVGIPLLLMPQTRLYAGGVVALIVAGVIAWRRYKKRPAVFVTDQRIVERTLLGKTTIQLADIVSYRRRIDTYYYRGTSSQVATNHLLFTLKSGRGQSIGPVLEYDELAGLLDGVLSRDIDPTVMRSLDGQPAAAEQRADLFVAVDNRTGGEAYGPLVIGPRGLVRFTGRLPIGLEGQLLTALSRPSPPEELENRAVFLTRRPDAGHALLVDLSTAKLRLSGSTLELDVKERVEPIELSAADAERARKFLEARSAASTS